jgi:ribonucleoside-diphosphate reductase alpha chain
MDDILRKVHEAGLTLKCGCGIGYEFSTLRPRGAYVSGAGAYTSGPLSFMDIFDKMCFTISSAGGRRGAQMATFDVGHPDVRDFIRAKREDGRLRQFNLSCLITDEFMQAVKNDAVEARLPARAQRGRGIDLDDPAQVVWRRWPIKEGYIANEAGLVACKIYKTLRARRLWDVIMSSTYDYAEPGFILIDKVNEMNNNWFCENIRATNPCVTADTRLHTQYGLIPIGELYARGVPLEVTVDTRSLGEPQHGTTVRTAVPAFMTAREADVYRVVTEDGYEIKATEWHDFYTTRGKIKLRDLVVGDPLLVQSGRDNSAEGSLELGLLLGLIPVMAMLRIPALRYWPGRAGGCRGLLGTGPSMAPLVAGYINAFITASATVARDYRGSSMAVPDRGHVFMRSVLLARVLEHYGFMANTKLQVPEVVWRGTEVCVKGFLCGLFQSDGTVKVSGKSQSCNIHLASKRQGLLKDVQVLLANFGIFCRVREQCNGAGGHKTTGQGDYELMIEGESRERFMQEIGFMSTANSKRYSDWVKGKALPKTQPFLSRVA